MELNDAFIEQAEAVAEAVREAEQYLAAAPGAVAAAKALARTLSRSLDPARIEESIIALADTWEQAEAREGVAAFIEKRKPVYRNC